jgi:pimeloyl-ACP methyl ester carboxylesterase
MQRRPPPRSSTVVMRSSSLIVRFSLGGSFVAEKRTYRFLRESEDSRCIVVFVHGLRGDMVQTWGMLPSFACNLTEYDVMLWSYPTFLFGSAPAVDSVGGLLLSGLRQHCSKYWDIVLVGHSLGCLVIESAIVLELRQHRATEDPVSKIRHVVLYAPPHAGSGAAAVLSHIPGLLSAQSRFLGARSAHLIELQREWVNRVYRPDPGLPAEDVAEINMTIVAGNQDTWVPHEVAQFVYSAQYLRRLDGTHSSIKRPTTSADPRFTILRDILKAALESSG